MNRQTEKCLECHRLMARDGERTRVRSLKTDFWHIKKLKLLDKAIKQYVSIPWTINVLPWISITTCWIKTVPDKNFFYQTLLKFQVVLTIYTGWQERQFQSSKWNTFNSLELTLTSTSLFVDLRCTQNCVSNLPKEYGIFKTKFVQGNLKMHAWASVTILVIVS